MTPLMEETHMPHSTMREPTASRPASSSTRSARNNHDFMDEAFLSYGSGIYDLVIRASRRQLKSLAQAEAEFALLLVEEPLVAIAFRFGDRSPWTLAPFDCPSTPDHDPSPPPESASDRALLSILLQQEDAPPLAVRNCTLSLDFSRALNSAVRDRMRGSINPSDQARALRRLTQKFPNIDSLVARAVVRSSGSP